MGIVYPVVRTGLVNVVLFCATRRILPAQSVAPGWRDLFRLSGFTESNPSQDVEKSFACRGTDGKGLENGYLEEDGESTPQSPLELLHDHCGPQVRIKIDNHTDNACRSGENRERMSNADRGTVPDLRAVIPQRPLPTLVREERGSMTSVASELTVVGEDRVKKAR